MESLATKTGPAQRYYQGQLVDGYLELNRQYIAFVPINDVALSVLLPWNNFRSVKIVQSAHRHPNLLRIERVGGNVPLVVQVDDITEWVAIIEKTVQLSKSF